MKLKTSSIIFVNTFVSISLSACSLNVGTEEAVLNTTLAEMMVSPYVLATDGLDEIEGKIEKLRKHAPYDVDVSIGDGLENCDELSKFEIKSNKVPSVKNGSKIYLNNIGVSVRVREKYTVEMIFLGQELDLTVTGLYMPLNLSSFKISHGDTIIYSGDARSENTIQSVKSMISDCTLGDILDGYMKTQG